MIPLIDYLLEMVELDESFKAYLRSTTARESAEIQERYIERYIVYQWH